MVIVIEVYSTFIWGCRTFILERLGCYLTACRWTAVFLSASVRIISIINHGMTGSTYRYAVSIQMFLLIILSGRFVASIMINHRRNVVSMEILIDGCAVSSRVRVEVFVMDIRIHVKELCGCSNA